MLFESLVKDYLDELQREVSNLRSTTEGTPELAYRPAIDGFLKKVADFVYPDVLVIYEPRKQGSAGRPDWRFSNKNTFGVYGYGEAKALDLRSRLSPTDYKEQLDRYLNLGRNLILTDGIDFAFCQPDGSIAQTSLISKPLALTTPWSQQTLSLEFEQHLRAFLKREGFRNLTEVRLIQEIAERAKVLSADIEDLCDLTPGAARNETERKTIVALSNLRRLLQNHHDPALKSPKAFSSFVAQVLIFGLFYSYRVTAPLNRDAKGLYEVMTEFWASSSYAGYTAHLRPIGGLVQLLEEELNSLGGIGVWYDDCRRLLANVRLEGGGNASPDYHALYEKFLQVFDPETRFDYGAFYTPPELARFAVKLTEGVVGTEFQGQSLYAEGNKLIDPCCGTGNFLEQMIKSAGTLRDKPTIAGFEILPAPYALAHYRLSMLGGSQTGYPDNVAIVLTDTLSDELDSTATPDLSVFVGVEQNHAKELARPPITLVIGNPPSSDSSKRIEGRHRAVINKLAEDFRPPPSKRRRRQNVQKQVSNECVKFLRWSVEKLVRSPRGVLTVVLPASFGDDVSYKYARKWMLERFPKIWCVDLDKDGRTGVNASSIFHTLQGRMLLIAVRPSDESGRATNVNYFSIADLTREQKLQELEKERTNYLELFRSIPIASNTLAFRPQRPFNAELYSKFWSIYSESETATAEEHSVFLRHVSGVKLSPSGLLVHVDGEILSRRSRELAKVGFSYHDFKMKWFSGQMKIPSSRKLTDDVRERVSGAVGQPDSILGYSYRPFLTMRAIVSAPALKALSRTHNSGTRSRPELLATFKKNPIGISVAPAPRHLGERLHRFTSFCWNLPDDDLCSRGSARILCPEFPEYKKKRTWNSTLQPNINPTLLQSLKELVGERKNWLEDITFYAYALLCSDEYLEAFEGTLYAGPDSAPKIPFPKDKEVFSKVAEIGRTLALFEKTETQVDNPPEVASLAKLYTREFELEDFKVDEALERIVLVSRSGSSLSLEPVPREILKFMVSGYQVVRVWLKFHTWAYTRTTFTRENYESLLSLITRIGKQQELVAELDRLIKPMIEGQVPLI